MRLMNQLFPHRTLKTPTILQMEATECGAAALAIILGYYGRFVPLAELRIACGVSRDGSNALNIVQAARAYDLEAAGAKLELEELNEASFPFIAFWEFNHFVVVESVDKNDVYINDPATGPRRITLDEFDRAFTGVILMFSPGANFLPSGQKTNLWHSLKPRLERVKTALLFIILVSVSLIVPGILVPGFIKIFIDNILIQQTTSWLLPLLWGLLIAGLVQMGLGYVQQYYLLRLNLKLSVTSSASFFWHVLRLPINFFSQRLIGDIQSRLNANDRIAVWLSGDLSTSVVSLISMVFFAVIMFLYDPVLASFCILITLINASLLTFISQHIQNRSYRLQQELGKLTGIEMIGLQAIETIKAGSEENNFFQRWAGYHAKTLIGRQKIELYTRFLQIIPHLLMGLTIVAILGIGGLRIMMGVLTIGSLVAFQALFFAFSQPLLGLINVTNTLLQLRGDLMRLEDVNHHPEDQRFSSSSSVAEIEPGKPLQLALEHVSFGYSPLEKPLLENINLLVEPGKWLSIVGATGSGKSTLIKLICGLYSPWSGEIFCNDIPLKKINLSSFSQCIGYVGQDVFLIEGTVRQNITMWHESISAAAIDQAVQDVGLVQVLADKPQGLETVVAYAGNNFSGGQRQQIDIARVLALNPALLILDEATSSMDTITEQLVMSNIKKRGCGLIVVAHRLSTIRDSDEILVMEQGRIIERGNHDQLVKNKNAYFRLITSSGEMNG